MYIQSIDIDGFKSYAQRVSLQSFDQSFNAITGLNGSGKSNILDAICFVLGIKNLSQVRATNLQELVYKQGQAGTTKATVSITWHNDDPENGPSGYEDKEYITITRQIVIGGRNKYLVNGHAAQENRITDLFHSVQLNVNNPHFLIMQGCITKVLNMKPPEILSLLEEAAGTRMYEKKKDAAMKTLDKKQSRLDQIDAVLQGDIVPSLELLRQQRGQYNEWAKLSSRAEQLKRIIVAYDYCKCLNQSIKANEDVAELQRKLEDLCGDKARSQADLDDVEGLVRALLTEVELQAGGETLELQARVDQLAMELTRGTTTWRSKCDSLASEQATLDSLQASLQELSEQDHEAKVARATEARAEAQAAMEAAEGSVAAAQREAAGAEAGDGRDESNRSLQERLADAQTDATRADSEAKAADVRAKHLAKQLAEQQKVLSSKQHDAGALHKELAHQKALVDKSTKRLEALAFDEAAHAALEEAREAQSVEVSRTREVVDRLSQDVAGWCDFRYTPPTASFDKSRVHGVLARLVQVKDVSTTVALEVAAGSRLYQVVVDDASTAQALLEKGRLTQRVTIIPLDKVHAPSLPSNVVSAAQRMGGGKAKPALELVGSAEHLQAALKYAFGTSLVCEDAATARRLAFSREVSARCVTLDGDDFNPSGLLTGGSRPGGRCVLATLHELAAAEERLEVACAKLADIECQLAGAAKAQAEYNKLRQEVALASHSLTLLQERMACSESAQLAASVAALSTELAESKQAAEAARARSKEVAALSKTLEREIANFSKEQGARLQAAKDKLKTAKAGVDRCRKALKVAEQQVAMANAERDAVGEERVGLQSKIEAALQAVAKLKTEEAALRESTASLRVAYEGVVAQLASRKKRMQESDEEIAGHRQAAARLTRAIQDLDVEVHKIEKKMHALAEHGKNCADFAAKVEKDFAWVSVEKAGFGSGDYNFANYDMRKCKKDYAEAEGRSSELKGRVNSKALDKLEKAESEYNSLMSKRQIVDNDRQCILQVIEDLDDKKKVAMKDTWHKVNGFFSSIFTTLLPGAQAKLVPPENQTFLEGLEVKVAFGGVWKESLTELSGGQRSLLALSLLLALCRFQPAPLYILDEVDAALDLNHTQNIGSMIKAHFPQSQFIVVSLKEGMFNNANVIYRTKFVDGVSTVTRTVTQRGRTEQQKGSCAVTPAAETGTSGLFCLGGGLLAGSMVGLLTGLSAGPAAHQVVCSRPGQALQQTLTDAKF